MPRLGCMLAAALITLGCGSDDEPTTTGAGSEGAPGSTGIIEGFIRLADGAELPGYPVNPMTPTATMAPTPASCTAPNEEDRFPLPLGAGRGLAGVLVALSDFSTAPRHEPVTHEMHIRDCRLTPRLLVATRGDRLRLTNESDYPFLPDLGTGLMQAILRGNDRELELAQGGARSLTCGFAAQCGRAEVITLYHPLHAVTGEDGRFRIEGVPMNEEVLVSAWHPLLGESSRRVRAGTTDVELLVSPSDMATAAPPPPGPPRPEGRAEDHPEVLF